MSDDLIRHRLVCAWCGALITPGDPGAPISHGICHQCAERELDRCPDCGAGPDEIHETDCCAAVRADGIR